MKKVALLEIDGTHEECVYSQLLFLKKGGYETAFIYEADLKKKLQDMNAGNLEVPFSIKGKKGLEYWKTLWSIRNYLVTHEYRTIIFNSTHGNLIRNFTLLPFPAGYRFFGTLHGINKLHGSFTQRIISRRIRNYYLLNDYLKENLKEVPYDKSLRFESFYPIYFPEFSGQPKIEKPADELWVGIPGQVEYKRREYENLVRAFGALKEKPKYRFLLLGDDKHRDSDAERLKEVIRSCKVEEYFVFTGYLSYPAYHAYLKQCDVIAPLIHPGTEGYRKYFFYQITGGYNLAFAYKKPLMMLSEFKRYADFEENAVFYTLEGIGEMLQHLKVRLEEVRGRMYRSSKWEFDYQAKQYLDFLR